MNSHIFKRIAKNEMINTSFYTGIGTVIAQITGVVVMKIIAVTLGATGVAMISQFIDFIKLSSSIATGGIQQGVVKYVAEFKNKKDELSKILSTSLRITLVSTIFFGLVIFIFSSFISNYLFKTNEYHFIVKIFAFTILLFGLNILLIRILNGTGEIKKMVTVNISNSIFGLFVTTSASYFFGLKGALIALSISQSIIFFISLTFVVKSEWYHKSLFNRGFDRTNVIRLIGFTMMGICSMVLGPLVNIGIRRYIIENLTVYDAGLWSGMLRISQSFSGLVLVTLPYYFLPKLSSLSDRKMIRKEIWHGQIIILPLLLILLFILFLFREKIILLVFSRDFIDMKYLFVPQLIGDFFRVASFFFSYLMLAKAKVALFISTSICFATITYFLSIFFINKIGLVGAVYAHAIKYFIYMLSMGYLMRKYVFAK